MEFTSIFLFLILVNVIYSVVRFIIRIQRVEDITSKYVFITGCDTGFGRLLAKKLDRQGVPVFAGCLTTEGCRTLSEESSSRLNSLILDVTSEESIINAYNYVEQHLPDKTGLWGLVNNAGVMPSYCPSEMLRKKDFEEVCQVNLFGTISMTLKFLPLIRQTKGRVVNVSSIVSVASIPGITNYCVSKAAVKTFTVCLRRELLGSGVTFISIEPGAFATQVTSLSRLKSTLLKAYKRSNAEVRDFYGGNIYGFVYFGYKFPAPIAQKLDRVINAMEHGLFGKFPQLSYVVGFDARWFFKPLSLLPDWVGDNILCWPKPYGRICEEMQADLVSGTYD